MSGVGPFDYFYRCLGRECRVIGGHGVSSKEANEHFPKKFFNKLECVICPKTLC